MNVTIFTSEFKKATVIIGKYSICTIIVIKFNIWTVIVAKYNFSSVFETTIQYVSLDCGQIDNIHILIHFCKGFFLKYNIKKNPGSVMYLWYISCITSCIYKP
jgi:hypothetical protein